MLQVTSNLTGNYLVLVLFLGLIGCRLDSHGPSEEKTAYLADYERPDNLWGFMDTTGQLVIPAEYDDVAGFSERMAAINKSGLWGFINHEGKTIIRPQFRSAYAFHEKMARV